MMRYAQSVQFGDLLKRFENEIKDNPNITDKAKRVCEAAMLELAILLSEKQEKAAAYKNSKVEENTELSQSNLCHNLNDLIQIYAKLEACVAQNTAKKSYIGDKPIISEVMKPILDRPLKRMVSDVKRFAYIDGNKCKNNPFMEFVYHVNMIHKYWLNQQNDAKPSTVSELKKEGAFSEKVDKFISNSSKSLKKMTSKLPWVGKENSRG